MRVIGAFLALGFSLSVFVASAAAAPFTAGNIVVVRVGDGASNHTNTGDPVFLDEYTAAGTLVQSVALPTTASGAQKQLLLAFSGVSTITGSEGMMARSANGQYLVVAGYGRDVGGAGGASATDPASVPRTIARVGYDGTVDTSTALSDFGPSGGSAPRGVTSNDGSAYYLAGLMTASPTTNPPIRYALHGASTSTALSTTVQTANGLRVPAIFSGRLFVSSTNTTPAVKLGTVGTGLPTTGGQTITQFSAAIDAAVTTPNGFAFFDLDAGVAGDDTLYVADEQSTASGTDGVIRKFSFDGSAWTARGTATAVDVRGLTGSVAGGTVTLYGSTGGTAGTPHTSAIYKLADATGSTGTLTGSATTLTSIASTTNQSLRGIALAPEAPPTLSRAPVSLAFGDQDIDDGATAAQESTVTNGGSQTVMLTSVTLGGAGASHFERLTGNPSDCAAGTTLLAGETCKVRADFDPATTGAKSATVTVASNAPDVTVDLTGAGTQTSLATSPPSLDFGFQDVDDGPTAAQPSTVTNTGTEPVTLTAISADPAAFERLTGEASDCANGTALNAGETCAVRVRFDPSAIGDATGSIIVSSSAPDTAIDLEGTGTQTELTRVPSLLAFGSQDVGAGPTASQTSTVTNSGTSPVTLTTVTVDGANADQFERLTGAGTDCGDGTVLGPADTCEVRVRFDPASTGAKAASVTVTSSAGPLSVSLTGTGTRTELTAAPATLPFGSREIGAGPTAAQDSTVTNTGTEPVTLTAVTVGGINGAEFERLTGQATDCAAGTTLLAGQTCAVRARFDPTSVGAKTGAVTLSSNAPDAGVALAGTGTHTELSRAPATLTFGPQDADAGASAAQESTITNSGAASVTITSVAVTGGDAGQFARLTGNPTDCAAGTTLAAGATCTVRVQFDPVAAGAKAAQVTVASNAPDVSVALTGTGTRTALARAPGLLAFGARDVNDGPTAAQEAVVTNAGSEPVTLTGVALGGAAGDQFEQLGGDPADCAASRTLAAGETCKLRMRFRPTSAGSKSATVTVTSNAPAVSVTLAGTGTGSLPTPPANPPGGPSGPKDTPPTTPPSVRMSSKAIALSRSGKLALRITCRGTRTCTGTISVRTAKPVRVGKKRTKLELAKGRASVKAGKTKTLVLRAGKTARKVVSSLRSVKVIVTVKLTHTGGKPVRRTFKTTVKGAR